MNALKFFTVLTFVTSAYGGPCDNVVSISNSWTGGYTATLVIPIKTSITSWKIDLTLSTAITNLEVWNAVSSTTNKILFTLINMSYNGVQTAGTTFNTVGFNVWYPSTNPMPTITQILFNGVNICSTAVTPTTLSPATTTTTPAPATTTTTRAPTTTVTSATTQTPAPSPATTAQPSGSCSSAVSISSSWAEGYTATLIIPVSSTVSSWTIDVTFSTAITSLQVWNAGASSSNNIKFSLVNMGYNGYQTAGTVLNSVGFNVYFPTGTTQPTITSIAFNGANVCSGSSVVTTTTPSTTPTGNPVTTTAPAGPTTTTIPTTTPAPLNGTKYNYAEVITKSLLFYYAQRSGRLPANENPIPYRFDSALNDVGQNGEDLTGGYYDAGDHVKFGFPMAAMTTVVAWSAIDYPLGYSSAGQMAQVRSMLKWATDYFIKAHVAPMKFYGQVGDGNADHAYWGRPEDMTMARPSYFISTSAPGSELAGETAAALAATSMVFAKVDPTYAALCLSHARDLYTLGKQYLGKYSDSIPNAANFYRSWSSYGDELAWSAVWMYRATNEAAYLNDAKSFYSQYGLSNMPISFSWDDKTAGVQVLLAKLTGDASYVNAATAYCNAKVSQPKTPKGLLFIDTWGPLRYASNIAFICLQAADLPSVPASTALSYRKFAQQQIHYALGDTGRSFVCGFGVNPPVKPHHRSSSCPNKPAICDWNNYNSAGANPQILYGALVGGPDANDNYSDDRTNYVANEVATDYNAGFQGAVAALQSLAAQGIFA